MPIYNAECKDCGKTSELLSRKYLEEGEMIIGNCSHCGSEKVFKKFTGTITQGHFGMRSWKHGLSVNQQTDKLLGGHNIEQV